MIRAVNFTPEPAVASAPVAFDPAQIGIKGSPTIGRGRPHAQPEEGRRARHRQPGRACRGRGAALAAARTAGVLVETLLRGAILDGVGDSALEKRFHWESI